MLSPAVLESQEARASTEPCGSLSAQYSPENLPAYEHIVVIMDENLSYANWKNNSQAPYTRALAAACGSEAFFHAATRPSQPNYMAATSGIASGVAVKTGVDNIFHQAQVAGDSWKAYQESMPSNCAGSTGFYKTGHNPPFWYTNLRSPTNTCAANDVPLSPALDNAIAADNLPTLSWITPNLCNDMHGATNCPQPNSMRVKVGDSWLANWVPKLTAMPSYKNGKTLIVVTMDEGNGAGAGGIDCTNPSVYSNLPACQIPTIVVSPYIRPGSVDTTDLNLYGLLGTIEDILGYPRLNRAVGQTSLRPGLGF